MKEKLDNLYKFMEPNLCLVLDHGAENLGKLDFVIYRRDILGLKQLFGLFVGAIMIWM